MNIINLRWEDPAEMGRREELPQETWKSLLDELARGNHNKVLVQLPGLQEAFPQYESSLTGLKIRALFGLREYASVVTTAGTLLEAGQGDITDAVQLGHGFLRTVASTSRAKRTIDPWLRTCRSISGWIK